MSAAVAVAIHLAPELAPEFALRTLKSCEAALGAEQCRLTDEDLTEYDTNLKVYPPLRDKSAVEVLRQGVKDGLVDCIASHHLPHEFDSKVVEFEYARPGMSSLETAYPLVQTLFPDMTPEKIADLFGARPRQLFGLSQPAIVEGEPAVLTFFDPAGTTVLEEGTTRSKSKNTPFFGKTLKGKVLGICNGEKITVQ